MTKIPFVADIYWQQLHSRTNKKITARTGENARWNRRYKNLAELAVVCQKMSKSLVTEYEDGKRKKIKKKW